jgi:hypothetical protein
VAQQLGEMIDKWYYMKIKSFCTSKYMGTRLERLTTEWEKIFASYTSDNELITRELKKLNFPPKTNDPMKEWANELDKAFQMRSPNGKKTHEEMLTISANK